MHQKPKNVTFHTRESSRTIFALRLHLHCMQPIGFKTLKLHADYELHGHDIKIDSGPLDGLINYPIEEVRKRI